MKILLTSTSFQDTPGKHQEKLNQQHFEIHTLRGPVKQEVLLPVIGQYEGIICGDDEITERVIAAGKAGKLKIISKYGVGLDKIDLEAARKHQIPVTNCPGVNHITVAEHVMALLLTFYKNIHKEHEITQKGQWKRLVGHELYHKTLGIAGLGKIGKEVAIRAKAFGMHLIAYDPQLDTAFCESLRITPANSLPELVAHSEIVSLNLPLTPATQHIFSRRILEENVHPNTLIVNTARGKLIDMRALAEALRNKKIAGYLTDVLEEEPMQPKHPLLEFDNVIITPHIGSRTFQSVERQGLMAVNNLLNALKII